MTMIRSVKLMKRTKKLVCFQSPPISTSAMSNAIIPLSLSSIFHQSRYERAINRFMTTEVNNHNNSFSSSSMTDFHYNRDTGVVSLLTHTKRGSEELYQTVIGLEIHAQLLVKTKLFSTSPTTSSPSSSSSEETNNLISPLDVGYPGFLPILNGDALIKALISARALNCEISEVSRFERKHYFYKDLALGYQITQQRWPLAHNGYIELSFDETDNKKKNKKNKKKKMNENVETAKNTMMIGIERIQLEQDTGKTITVSTEEEQKDKIDFNRAGQALIEIVFRPDIRSATQASKCVETLTQLLKYIKACDGKMENGSLRCDLNISIAPLSSFSLEGDLMNDCDEDDDNNNPFQKMLPKGTGQRVEVKNLNSLKQIVWATEYEAKRQASLRYNKCKQSIHQNYNDGTESFSPETRTFDVKTKRTVKIRDKGDAVDYRFMPGKITFLFSIII